MKTATQKAVSRPGPGLGDGVLVDPGWLAGHLKDADLRVVEVDVSPAAYDSWHIDGAVLWNVYTDLKDAGYRAASTAALQRLVAVHDAIAQPGTTLVDVRSAAEYRGDCFWLSGGMEPGGRTGHVPSAVHQPIDGLYNPDGSFRSATELCSVFSPAVLGGGHERRAAQSSPVRTAAQRFTLLLGGISGGRALRLWC
jgi:3-mercaptopyruvate sulfurtransferase SseA